MVTGTEGGFKLGDLVKTGIITPKSEFEVEEGGDWAVVERWGMLKVNKGRIDRESSYSCTYREL